MGRALGIFQGILKLDRGDGPRKGKYAGQSDSLTCGSGLEDAIFPSGSCESLVSALVLQ